jgi:hypothetical protein
VSDSDGIEVEERHGAWTVRMWWSADRAEGGPQRVVIEAAPEAPARDIARGISTTVLRSINPAEAAQRAAARRGEAPASAGIEPSLSGILRQQLADQGVSGRYLAVLSTVYARLSAAGARPLVPQLAEVVGRSVETVSGHLKQARRDGYLTASVSGKPGGEPTSKSVETLKKLGLAPDEN